MDGIAVHDDVDVQAVGDVTVGRLQELEEPPGPAALADDSAGGGVGSGITGASAGGMAGKRLRYHGLVADSGLRSGAGA